MTQNTCSLYNLGELLQHLASVIATIGGLPPVQARCPECGGQWSVWKQLCPLSQDYACGYRTIWKCENPACREMELK